MCGQCQHPGHKGGDQTGPNPTDWGKLGTKRQGIVDRRGTPLALRLTRANRHDGALFEELVDGVPSIKPRRGRPRRRPDKLHAYKAYDIPRCRQFLRRRHITVRIARKGSESREKLGRHRWVVERTLAWLDQFRRLTMRDERRADIHEAFPTLGCALLWFNAVHRFCLTLL